MAPEHNKPGGEDKEGDWVRYHLDLNRNILEIASKVQNVTSTQPYPREKGKIENLHVSGGKVEVTRGNKSDSDKSKQHLSGVLPRDAVSGLQGVKMRILNPTPSGEDADYETITTKGRTEEVICETLNERDIGPLQMAKTLISRDEGISQALAHHHITKDDVEGMGFEVGYALLELYPETSRPKWQKVLEDAQKKRARRSSKN